MVDLINALSCNYHEVLISSNKGGIFREDLKRIECSVNCRSIFFFEGLIATPVLKKYTKFIQRALLFISLILEPLIMLINIALFVFAIQRNKPSNILICNGGYPAARSCLAMVVASRIMKIPSILSIVSMPIPRRWYCSLYDRVIDNLVWKSVDIVIVNARSIAIALSELRGMPDNKVEVIFNGVNDQQYHSLKEANADQFVIGCVSRMDASKGVLVLLESFANLSKQFKNLQLILVGHGNAFYELKNKTIELGIQKQVNLVGHYEGNIYELIQTFDAYVFPSLWEGLPYSIIEAMCSARAIIATKVGGIPEIINDGIDGLLINPNSSNEISDALEQLICREDLRRTLATNARKKFLRGLTLEHMRLRMEKICGILSNK